MKSIYIFGFSTNQQQTNIFFALSQETCGSKMAMRKWDNALSPNYNNNVDKLYPYSEVPFIGQYKLVKIPLGSGLIELVDYWGEGRLYSEAGVSGFPDCYNVNHPSQCVSNGTDRDRKIPNRVPVRSYTDCDTRSYIKDNSVKTVTLMGAPINNSCAKDIERMINDTRGRVIVFGFDDASADITNLKRELRNKNLIICDGYDLPNNLRGVTLFESNRDTHDLQMTLQMMIKDARYDEAVEMSKKLAFGSFPNVIREVVSGIIKEKNNKIMNFAYKLWNNGAQSIVIKYFPTQFKLIFNEDDVTIVNKKYPLALKLAKSMVDLDKMAFGDSQDKYSKRVSWRFLPIWSNNSVQFRILNVDCGMFLKLAIYTDRYEDREAWGSFGISRSDDSTYFNRCLWYLDPVMLDGELLFFIMNKQYDKGLKLAASPDWDSDRQLWGHHSDVHDDPGYYGWSIKSWK